jgi:nicotinate-nucleotide adenylyltransferase
MSAQPELAILGGSFDPPHFGHVFLAAYALGTRAVERVIVVPVFQHAFDKPLSPFEHRIQMCQLAFRDLRRVEVSDLERELGGVSRTLRLVEALSERYPNHRLRTLVGADILAQRARWQGFDEIERRAPLLTAGRAGHPPPLGTAAPMLPEISSTEVRAALARGQLPEDKVPSAVLAYAEANGLYETDPAP